MSLLNVLVQKFKAKKLGRQRNGQNEVVDFEARAHVEQARKQFEYLKEKGLNLPIFTL
jgi:hypothetical protein